MASTYSTLKIELIGTGEQAGLWGTTTNTNLGTALEEAIVGSADVTFSSADVTLTLTNTNATQTARHVRLNLTGTSGGVRNLILGSGCQIDKPYLINNGLADTVTVKNTTGTGIAVPAGKTMWVYNNGTNVVDAVTHLSSLTLGTALPITSGGTGSTSTTFVNLATNVTGTLPIANGGTGTTSTTFVNLATNVTGTLPVANGGTGGATQAAGRTGLGATTLGANLFTITNPSAVTFPRFNADNTVSALDAASFRTAIGAGSGTGTVTSVGGTGTVNGITLTGTVTSSGNLTLGGTLSGVSLTTAVTGTLPLANGGTGAALTDPNADRILFWDDSAGATTWLTVSTGLSISGTTLTNSGVTSYPGAGIAVSTGSAWTTSLTAPSGTIVGTTDTQTLTNKRITNRIGTVSSASTITPTGDSSDQYNVTALAVPATIAAPSGTPTDGQKLVIRIEDNGTARALTWTTTSGAYRAVGVTLPTTTVATKVVYIGCIYNAQDVFWDVIAVAQQA